MWGSVGGGVGKCVGVWGRYKRRCGKRCGEVLEEEWENVLGVWGR